MTIEGLIAAQRYEEALRLAQQEVKENPGDHRLLNLCADLFVFLRQEAAAERVLLHVADLHVSEGAPGKAVVALKKVQGLGRGDEAMYDSLAWRMRNHAPTMEVDISDILSSVTFESRDEPQAIVEEAVADAAASPLFDAFAREELLAFIKGLQLQVYDSGDIIVAEGDPGDSLYLLTSGVAKAYVRDRDRRYRQVGTLRDGDFFGEISILSGGKRTATITAATRCELLEIDRPTLDAITAAHPHVADVMRRFHDERLGSDRRL